MTEQTDQTIQYSQPPDPSGLPPTYKPTTEQAQVIAAETDTEVETSETETIEAETVEETPTETPDNSEIAVIEDLWKQNKQLRRQLQRQKKELQTKNSLPPEVIEPPEKETPLPPLKLSRRKQRRRQLRFRL